MRWGVLCLLVACNDTQSGNQPVGGQVDSAAAVERYVRHATLDLSGSPPADADLQATAGQLRGQGNTAAARGTFVDGLIANAAFPKTWIEELENGIFGGNTLDNQYALICSILRSSTQDCLSCTAADSCTCTCPEIAPLLTERTQLRMNASDLGGGTASSAIERRYALAEGYYALAGSPEGRVKNLFTDFLARTAEPDEIENGRAMILGQIIPG